MNPEACAEMDYILNNISEEDSNKIPDEFKKMFKEKMSQTYVVKLNMDKPLYEQEVLPETKVYLAAIYREFLCSEQEKKEYEEQYRKEEAAEQEKMKELLKNDIFYNEEARKRSEEKKKLEEKEREEQARDMVVYKKESIFSRIINLVRKLFGGQKG